MTNSNNSNPLAYFSAYKSDDGERNISKTDLLMNCGSWGWGAVWLFWGSGGGVCLFVSFYLYII